MSTHPITGGARFGLARFGTPGGGDRYEVFISSANECAPARTLCREIIYGAVNPTLGTERGAPMLVPVMWEDALPQRVEGETINDFFVRVALECHATIVLFESVLGAGTKDEVLALLERPRSEQTPLAVIAFEPTDGRIRSAELTGFLQLIGQVAGILYASTGSMNSQDAAVTVAKVTWGFAFSAAARSRQPQLENDAI